MPRACSGRGAMLRPPGPARPGPALPFPRRGGAGRCFRAAAGPGRRDAAAARGLPAAADRQRHHGGPDPVSAAASVYPACAMDPRARGGDGELRCSSQTWGWAGVLNTSVRHFNAQGWECPPLTSFFIHYPFGTRGSVQIPPSPLPPSKVSKNARALSFCREGEGGNQTASHAGCRVSRDGRGTAVSLRSPAILGVFFPQVWAMVRACGGLWRAGFSSPFLQAAVFT